MDNSENSAGSCSAEHKEHGPGFEGIIERYLVFMDTNVIIPQTSWRLYDNELSQTQQSGYLKRATDIDEALIDEATLDLDFMIQILLRSADACHGIRFTEGVSAQALSKVENIISNIERRKRDFIFTEFNAILPEDLRVSSREIHSKLADYGQNIETIHKEIDNRRYLSPSDRVYFTLSNFVRHMKYDLFQIGKEDHKFDFAVDEMIVVSAIYETMVNKTDVAVFSNDNDVSSLLGVVNEAFQKMEPVIRYRDNLRPILQSPPHIYKFNNRDEGIIRDDDSKGSRIIMELRGFGNSDDYHIPSEDKPSYMRRVSEFAFFLDKMTEQLDYALSELNKGQ